MQPLVICLAGAESSGKSQLARRLGAHFEVQEIEEYAREYCAKHGNHLAMHQLLHVAETQDRLIREATLAAKAKHEPVVISDTDAVATAAWALEGWGRVDPWFDREHAPVDLTLVMDNDLPWVNDGVRIQADLRRRERFRTTLIAELEKRGRRWVAIGGKNKLRFTNALAAIAPLLRQD